MKIGIIDYQAGNLQSVANAFRAIGANAEIITKPVETEDLTHLVLPGQGEFGDCARKLEQAGMFAVIQDWIKLNKPFLGICVGYQLLFEGSDESPETSGLGIFKGRCKKFDDRGLKVPHIGWNAVVPCDPTQKMWHNLADKPFFYFVHSYFPHCEQEEVLAGSTEYGERFHSAVTQGRLMATQFHPEKSQHAGLQLLKNFITI
jgi:imidazole glycerol-phosphate synthase subunit HisH